MTSSSKSESEVPEPTAVDHSAPSRPRLDLWPILWLFAVTAMIYWRHLIAGFTFPHDFTATSRWGLFVTNTFAAGHFTEWNPFAGGGLSLPYNAASGLYFPVWWAMGLLRIPPTVTILTWVQVGHVLLGGAGVYVLAKAIGVERRWALLAGTAFLFFGGMFSNGGHDVIVRGHAYAPWILWSLTPRADGFSWRRVVSFPLWVWLLGSGAYPGQAMAFLQVAAVYLAAQLFVHRSRLREFLPYLVPSVVGAIAVMSALYYPAQVANAAGELYRANPPGAAIRATFALHLSDLWGLYLDPFAWDLSHPLGGTITGWAIGCVALVGLASVRWPDIRRNLPLLLAGGTGFLLAILPSWLPAGRLMASASLLFPSRHSGSDSKAMAAVALVCFSAIGWANVARGRSRPWVPASAGIVLLAGLVLAPSTTDVPITSTPWLVAGVVVCAVTLAFFGDRLSSRLLFAILLALTLVDGARISSEMELLKGLSAWHIPSELFPERDLHDTQARQLPGQLDDPPVSRPARTELAPEFALRGGVQQDALGHLGSEYYLGDYGGAMTTARANVVRSPELRELMLRPWTGLVLPCGQLDCSGGEIAVPDLSTGQQGAIKTTFYGYSSIGYQVRLASKSLMVENELFARGWTADRPGVLPINLGGTLRGWVLPAGNYEFTASYALPERPVQKALAALAALSLVGAALLCYRSGRRYGAEVHVSQGSIVGKSSPPIQRVTAPSGLD